MYKIGQSNDIHKLKKNVFHKKIMIIGGTCINSDYRVKAHSDGDIILHSVAESIYGALGEGDLGSHFSDKKKENKNLCSIKILEHALSLLNEKGWEIVNIDFTVICEKVYFNHYKDKILKTLITILKTSNINFKATRWESNNNKIQSNCVVLIRKKDSKPQPLKEDRMIEFLSAANENYVEEVIKENNEVSPKNLTKEITEFINDINEEEKLTKKSKKESCIDEKGYFKRIKRINEE